MVERPSTSKDSGPLMSLSEAAAYLDMTVQTLYNWRSRGIGPASLRIGGRVKYRLTDLDDWIAAQAEVEADRLARITG
jgi:predicted DNA-binding transcriptional regulator AlpA